MPLDPRAKRLLDIVAIGRAPMAAELSAPKMREAIRQLARDTDVTDAIDSIQNRTIPGPSGDMAIRVYSPARDRESLPGALVYFHGGMMVFSDLDTHDGVCRMLANASGCRVVSVDYRLAPEHPFPAAIDDAMAATQWVFDHATELNADRGRIGVAGDSAGGTLASVVCQLARAAGEPRIALQVLLCPVTDLGAESASRREFASGYFIDRAVLEWAKAQYCPPGTNLEDPRISPIRADSFSGLPPAIIHTAQYDPVRDEGAAYAQALERAGVSVRYVCHSGMIHHFYCMGRIISHARTAIGDLGAEIAAMLSPRPESAR